MALIQSIVESPLDADITFIFASRQNEDIISFFASNIVPVLLVNPLSVKDAYFYTEEKLNLQEANPELILKVVNAAGGNPLFIDNMITELINSGTIIVNKNGTKTLSKSSSDKDEINIPTTMQNVILSRLSTLSYREQIVCKSASALGLKFNSTILMQILPEKMSQEEVDKMLADLVFHNIIDNDLVPDTFSFRTSYIHHIIYDTILETTKKEMNREILEVLENMYADDLSPYAEKLLFHAIEAQDNHKIYKYALAAAKNAELQFAFRDAMELYKTASEAANDFIKDKKSETIIQLQSSMKKTQLKLDEFDRSAGIVGKRPMVSRFTRLLQKFRNS
jgi:predicted ATPase